MNIVIKTIRENQHHDSALGDLCTDIIGAIEKGNDLERYIPTLGKELMSVKDWIYKVPQDEWNQLIYIKRLGKELPHTESAVKQLIKLIIKAL